MFDSILAPESLLTNLTKLTMHAADRALMDFCYTRVQYNNKESSLIGTLEVAVGIW